VSRPASDRYGEAVTGSISHRLVADVFYGAERVMKDLPISSNWSLKWDLESALKSAGSVLVQYAGDLADSLTPRDFSDLLAPYGAELNLLLEVSVGRAYTETILLGRFRITDVPNARDEHMRVLGSTLVAGSLVELTLADPLVKLERWGFRVESQPQSSSAWAELARISGMQLTRNVGDATIPNGLIYEPRKGGRLDAVQTLAGFLGGRAYTTPDNTLSVMPYSYGSTPDFELKLGDRGTIIDAQHSMTSEDVINELVGTFENTDGDRTPIYRYSSIDLGRLAVNSPYGPNTGYYNASGSYTPESAQAANDAELQRRLAANTYRVPVTALADARIMFGDVVSVERPDGVTVGRVMNNSLSGSGLMQAELQVRRVIA
jgi:hypothetical protein